MKHSHLLPVSTACLALLLATHQDTHAATVDPASALNATMTESTVELSALLATMNRKIHNGESFGFGERSWTGSTTATGFTWDLTGVYDGKNVTASAIGVYDPGSITVGASPTITWTTNLNFGGEKITSTGTNLMSVDESPSNGEANRGWKWKNVWKAVTQVATWVRKNWTEITIVADQLLTVVALPNPVTVAVQAVTSTGKIIVHQALPVATPLPGEEGLMAEAAAASDYEIGDILFGAGLQFSDIHNPVQVAGMSGSINAQMTVDANYVDRLAIGSISGSYSNPDLNGTVNAAPGFSGAATMGQAPEPGSLALAGAALALLGAVRHVNRRGRRMTLAAEAARRLASASSH
jgi:hypothetical protein